MLINGTSPKMLPTNISAEEIENIVVELARVTPERARLLRIHYFYPDEHEYRARKSGYSKSQYYLHLKLAHEWVKGFLSGRQ